MKPTPARELAVSDPKELEAIEAAMRAGRPLYFIQASSGTTLDVKLDQGVALRTWAEYADRLPGKYHDVNLFVRKGGFLFKYTPPQAKAA